MALVSPPVGLAELEWVQLAPLLVVLAAERPARRRFRIGWFAGVTAVLSLFYWLASTISRFGDSPWIVGVAGLAVYCAVFAVPYAVVGVAVVPLRRRYGPWWVLALPTMWVAVEWLQPAIFPSYQGSFQFRRPWVWQLASVLGPYGVSWLVVAMNATLAECWIRRREGAPVAGGALAVVSALMVANLGFGAWRHARVESALAAASTARVGFWQTARFTGIRDHRPLLEAAQALAASRPDLVVWPEGVLALTPDREPQQSALSAAARDGGFALLVGATTTAEDPDRPRHRRLWNSAWGFGPAGEVQGTYDKMRLVPFGERTPPILEPLGLGSGESSPGGSIVTFTTRSFSYTAPICYEAIIEPQVRLMADADVLVNITNDAWFGPTSEPYQHAMLAAAAAVQFGRPLVRVAHTGTTAVVEPHGAIVGETPIFTEVSGVLEVRLAAFPTVWRTWGRFFPHVCAAAAIVLLGLATRRARPRCGPPADSLHARPSDGRPTGGSRGAGRGR